MSKLPQIQNTQISMKGYKIMDYDIYAYNKNNNKELLVTVNDRNMAEYLLDLLSDLADNKNLRMKNGEEVNFISLEIDED